MTYKMIAMDMDDTLLDGEGKLTERTRESLKKAQEKGVKVVLASGRPTFGVRKAADELELKKYGGYIISYNGARIVEYQSEKELYGVNITRENVQELYDLSQQYGAEIQTYIGDNIIVSKANPYTDVEERLTGMRTIVREDFRDYIKEDVVKVIIVNAPEELQKMEQALKPVIGDRLYMTTSKPIFLEFMNRTVDKGQSLLRLADLLSIPHEEVIAVGDSYNDLSMIKAAGLGVAMGNAVDAVKEAADSITASNEKDGVAALVDKVILSSCGQ